MADLIAPNGAKVSASDDKVDELLRRGFTAGEKPKAPTKKASSSKSDEK